MARKKHLINVHTSTGTTAPTGASLYLGEIAVQHTPNDPALWIKVGSAETSTDYEKFIGETEINNEFHKTNHNIPYVIQSGDTYTGSTGNYTASTDELTELVDGQSIIFHPKCNSNTASTYSANTCSLNLELADGTMTGAKPIYLYGNTKVTTHLKGCSDIKLTYHENATVSATTGINGWWVDFYYDSNSDVIGYALRYNNVQRVTTSQMYRYRLMFTSADKNYWVPANSATSTNYTSARDATTTPIDPFGPIAYYATTAVINPGASPGFNTVYTQYSSVTLGYSFVFANSAMTAKLPVYLKCEPQGDGSAIIDATTPIVQSLPNEEDGKIYIFLGVAIDATAFELYEQHPIYEYRGGHVRHYQEGEEVEMILGPDYTYSGLPYVNSSTTIADAYSALTEEMLKDEKVVAAAFNDLNNRVSVISTSANNLDERVTALEEDSGTSEELQVLSGVVITLDDRVTVLEQNSGSSEGLETLSGVVITLDDRITAIEVSGSSSEELYELSGAVVSKEFVIATALNNINNNIIDFDDRITELELYSGLSADIEALSAKVISNEYVTSKSLNDFNERLDAVSGVVNDIYDIYPYVQSSIPEFGFEPNILYNLGTITQTTVFILAAPNRQDIVNHYYWTFDTSSTVPSVTWPAGLTWYGGAAPTLQANKHYEISILNGIAVSMEV